MGFFYDLHGAVGCPGKNGMVPSYQKVDGNCFLTHKDAQLFHTVMLSWIFMGSVCRSPGGMRVTSLGVCLPCSFVEI